MRGQPGRTGRSRRRSSRSGAGRTGSTSARTAVAVPSPRLRRSSPRRAWSGPSAPPSSRWTNPRTSRNPSSNASHGLRSRHWVAAGRRTWPPAIRRSAVRPARGQQAAGRQDGVQEGEPERGEDRRGAQVALDPVDDRGQADELARRVEREQLVDEVSAPSTDGNRSRSSARTSASPTSALSAGQVVGVERRLARAPSRRAGRGRPCSGSAARSAAAAPASPSRRPRRSTGSRRGRASGRRSRSASRTGRPARP